ncbi:hypothetical protein N9U94_02540 [Acidimicrobiaceae bacterium]|nr:hypothetical protein [Acidimicrobiaceae bacterium]
MSDKNDYEILKDEYSKAIIRTKNEINNLISQLDNTEFDESTKDDLKKKIDDLLLNSLFSSEEE